jgi:hypothetical protein
VADLIGTLDVEERARRKDNNGKDPESSAANMVQKRNFHASRNFKNKNKGKQAHNPKLKQTTDFKKKINKKKNEGCFVYGSIEHWSSACPSKFVKEKKSTNMVINEIGGVTSRYGNPLPYVLSVCNSPEWWMDSGAHIHVCDDISLFAGLEPC